MDNRKEKLGHSRLCLFKCSVSLKAHNSHKCMRYFKGMWHMFKARYLCSKYEKWDSVAVKMQMQSVTCVNIKTITHTIIKRIVFVYYLQYNLVFQFWLNTNFINIDLTSFSLKHFTALFPGKWETLVNSFKSLSMCLVLV